MNNVPNENGKVLEETLEAFNSDAVKTKLRGLRYFNTLFQNDPRPLISLSLYPI